MLIEIGSKSLHLKNAKINDSGVYECWANNSNGFDARVYTLKVTSTQILFLLIITQELLIFTDVVEKEDLICYFYLLNRKKDSLLK